MLTLIYLYIHTNYIKMNGKNLSIMSYYYWREKVVAIWMFILMFVKSLLPFGEREYSHKKGHNTYDSNNYRGIKRQRDVINLNGGCGPRG